jgi:hypothetical protein
MGEEFDDADDGGEELFNEDTDDTETVLRPGVKKHVCPKDNISLEYRVEGRFVIRFCKKCGYEEED